MKFGITKIIFSPFIFLLLLLSIFILILRMGGATTDNSEYIKLNTNKDPEIASTKYHESQVVERANHFQGPPTKAIAEDGRQYFILNDEVYLRKGQYEEQITSGSEKFGRKDFLLLSPNEKYLGFFQELSQEGQMSDEDYYWKNYYSLRIINLKSKKISEVYRGSYKVGDYEWLSNEEISVGVGCGTECGYLDLVNINTKHRIQLAYGVGYTWSPNKKLVLVYHYSLRDGITVGDKNGNILFTLKRNYPPDDQIVATHEAVWSPDSSKIALIIHKEKSPDLELVVLDVTNKFETTFLRDLAEHEFSKLSWRVPRTLTYNSGGKENSIIL